MMEQTTNLELELAWEFIQHTNQNVFLTGKAGTGKTTFLHDLRRVSPKRMIVVAPTGVAAINAGGVTIHSFFQVSFGPQIPARSAGDELFARRQQTQDPSRVRKMGREKISIIRSLDLLVIDEISMVRADLLDAIDEVLRRFRNRHKPFGGVQLLMIGDLQQLAPVVKENEWEILKNYYDTPFFFSSLALKESNFVGIELKHIYRQTNQHFIDLLNKIRDNVADAATIKELNLRYIPEFEPADEEGYITLTSHNYQAKNINENKLANLKAKVRKFKAKVDGDFPEASYPTEFELELKEGAQVMFVKNDSSPEKAYFNGKIGRIVKLASETIEVQCTDDYSPIKVTPEIWENSKYSIHATTQEIVEDVQGTFTQIPLKLAWAITIHKSQGLTFDKAIIDARLSFAHGQVYVALSRCRSLEGMVLRSPLSSFSIKIDESVKEFIQHVEDHPAGDDDLNQAKINFQQQLLLELFDFNPLVRRLQAFNKIWQDNNESLLGNLEEKTRQVLLSVQKDIIPVSGKFAEQIKQLTVNESDAEKNQQLQERLRKAASWYQETLESLVFRPFKEAGFETDNRAVRKSVNEAVERIAEILTEKRACLGEIFDKFSIVPFLEVKSKAALNTIPLLKSGKAGKASGLETVRHPMLYSKMVEWRDQVAESTGIHPFQILPQRTLHQIVNSLPATSVQLKKIEGIGKVRYREYGSHILKIVLKYLEESDIDVEFSADDLLPEKKKSDTKLITLNLLKEGKSIRKIAMERGFSESTIEGHLAHFIGCGEIGLEGLIPQEKIKMIIGFFMENSDASLADAYIRLDKKVSFGELRMVKEFMRFSEIN